MKPEGLCTACSSTQFCADHEPKRPSRFDVAKRCGFMADALVGAKVGPQARFFTRERVDEMVLLLREAEKKIIDLEADLRASSRLERVRKALVGLVGVETREELESLEAVMRLTPAPSADKAASIDAIHALLETL